MSGQLLTAPITFPLDIGTETDLGIRLTGLTVDHEHRVIQLAELPTLRASNPPSGGSVHVGHAGVATVGGRVFWVDSVSGMVNVRACDGSSAPIGCFGGTAWGQIGGIAAAGSRVFIADRERGRVVSVTTDDGQLIDLWQGLDAPGDLAVGPDGDIYVIVRAGIARLRAFGRWTLVSSVDNAVSVCADGQRLLVTTTAPSQLLMIDTETGVVEPLTLRPTAAGPWIVRVSDAFVLIASMTTEDQPMLPGSVEAFDRVTHRRVGDLPGAIAPVAGLAVDECGKVWISTGHTVAVAGDSRPVPWGQLEVGPLTLATSTDETRPKQLRLKIRGTFEPDSMHAEIVFGPSVPSPPISPATPSPTGLDDRLIDIPSNARTITIVVTLFAPPDSEIHSPGPVLQGIELRADEPGLLEQLPHIYRSQGNPDAFLDPFLRLLASGNDDVVDALEHLDLQFDPATASDHADGERWLDWLASWTDADIDDSWPTRRRRQVVADAFESHGRRGTASAVRERIALELDLDATIVEPGDLASLWVLGDGCTELGMTSMTSAAPAGGPIVGTTATVDRSHLIGPADSGAPLFGDLAHRFHVVITELGLDPNRLDQLRRIIEREKPAHTNAHICCPDSSFRLGLGGRIGIDLVIAEPSRANALEGLAGFEEPPDSLRLTAGPSLILS